MKFLGPYALEHRLDEERVIKKFLFWPKGFDESKTVRWLEFARITERIRSFNRRSYYDWEEIGFTDELSSSPAEGKDPT